jgi:hypothetical protein
MPRYVALVHKESDGCYGVSFPDLRFQKARCEKAVDHFLQQV